MSKDIKNIEKDFLKLQKKLRDFITFDAPDIIAIEAEEHFKSSFDNQGFTDKTLHKWKARDVELNPQKYSKKQRQRSAGRAILIGHNSGSHLRDSIYARVSAGSVILTAAKPYARVHNEGGRAGRNLSANIPQRQFIGPSAVLDSTIKTKFDTKLNKIFKHYG